MSKIIVKADDLGYSKGVNYGILDSVVNGVINNVGMMANMPWARMGFSLLKGLDICLGLHANISAGRPLLPVSRVSTLVNGQNFNSSTYYRESKKDLVDSNQVRAEIGAQIQQFKDIVGYLPKYVDIHAVGSKKFQVGVKQAAKDYGIPYLPTDFSGKVNEWKNYKLKVIVESSQPNYIPEKTVRNALASRDNQLLLFIFHPGFIDKYLHNNSSLQIPRILEEDYLCSQKIKDEFEKENVECVQIDNFF